MADPILKTYASQALAHFERASAALAFRQAGPATSEEGNVAPWPGSTDRDFHGTLAAIWIWARHQALSEQSRFAPNREAAWGFIEDVWQAFIPEAIGPDASDEATFDCAIVLRAALGELSITGGALDGRHARLADGAAHVLAAYLGDLDDVSGRDFEDPGFLAWNLIEYARAIEDRGLMAAGRRFVERAFGMKAAPVFAAEPETPGALFDFSATTATRVMAVMASEGNTPFVGAWLRERVARSIPPGFVKRTRDERCWNACVAALLGRAYVASTEARFLEAYRAIRAELERRNAEPANRNAAEGSEGGVGAADTLLLFYSSLAADALVPRAAAERTPDRGAHARG